MGRITSLVNRMTGTGAVVSQFSVPVPGGYDAAGNRLSLTATDNHSPTLSGTTSYTYDGKDRLTGETSTRNGGYTRLFGYDNAGNATTFKGNTYGFNLDNQFTGSAWVWDGKGDATNWNGTPASYDAEGQQISFGGSGGGGSSPMTYAWRPDGLRAWKQTSTPRLYYLYDGTTPVLEFYSDGYLKYRDTFGALGLISRLYASDTSSVFYAFDASMSGAAARSEPTPRAVSSPLA